MLKTPFQPDHAEKYGADEPRSCTCRKRDQECRARYEKPDYPCDKAWKAIYQYTFALAHGAKGNEWYYGDWIRKPRIAICSCNNGLRPVIFKLEATDIPDKPPISSDMEQASQTE